MFFDGSIVLQSRRFIRSEWYRIPVAFSRGFFAKSFNGTIDSEAEGWMSC